MLLIFCVLSVMFMMGLFYFVIGGVAFKGACSPLFAQKAARRALLEGLKSGSDDERNFTAEARSGGSAGEALRISKVINECEGASMIFNYLQVNRIYDIDDLARISVMSPMETELKLFEDLDLSNFSLVTEEDKELYLSVSKQEIGLIHHELWYDHLCFEYVPIDFNKVASGLKKLAQSLPWKSYQSAKAAFANEFINLYTFYRAYAPVLNDNIELLVDVIADVDSAILYEQYNFGDTLRILLKNILNTEIFIRDMGQSYLSNIGKNLTAVVNEQINDYIKMIVYEAKTEIGSCQPLSYIYERSLDKICSEMVDPIIGYWTGIVLSAFLLMIVLCIAHRLQCLYKQIQLMPFVPIKVTSTSCPFCIGRSERLAAGEPAQYCCCNLPTNGAAGTAIYDVEQAIGATANHPKTIRDSESSTDGKNKLD
ncbi:prominin-like protein isoform X2 [Drosophila obscura]|nr:prominin-like protein isoform X2 [Drosophila obscura]